MKQYRILIISYYRLSFSTCVLFLRKMSERLKKSGYHLIPTVLSCILVSLIFNKGYSQSTNDILNLLIKRNAITQEEADSLRSEAAIKQQDADAKKKSFPVSSGKALQISGFTQVRYQNLEQAGLKSGFDIRRARLDVRGTLSPYFGYRFMPEFGGITTKTPNVRLLDAVGEIRLVNFFNLSIGQQKVALSRENQESDNKYDFVDRSQVVNALVARSNDPIGDQNGRDIGVQANGNIQLSADRSLLEYYVGVFNGAGINTSENNGFKDVAARLVLHPLTGLDLGGSYYDGVGYYGPTAATSVSHGRTRWGLEFRYEYKRLLLQSEYLKGKDAPVNKFGYYAQAGFYLIPEKIQVLAKYDVYDPNKAQINDVSTWYTGGINFTFNSTTRLQLAYTAKKKEGGSTNANFAVAQFVVGF